MLKTQKTQRFRTLTLARRASARRAELMSEPSNTNRPCARIHNHLVIYANVVPFRRPTTGPRAEMAKSRARESMARKLRESSPMTAASPSPSRSRRSSIASTMSGWMYWPKWTQAENDRACRFPLAPGTRLPYILIMTTQTETAMKMLRAVTIFLCAGAPVNVYSLCQQQGATQMSDVNVQGVDT